MTPTSEDAGKASKGTDAPFSDYGDIVPEDEPEAERVPEDAGQTRESPDAPPDDDSEIIPDDDPDRTRKE